MYRAYEAALREAVVQVQRLSPGFAYGIKSAAHVTSRRLVQRFMPRPLKEALRRVMTLVGGKV